MIKQEVIGDHTTAKIKAWKVTCTDPDGDVTFKAFGGEVISQVCTEIFSHHEGRTVIPWCRLLQRQCVHTGKIVGENS